jgi:hypothetical protein
VLFDDFNRRRIKQARAEDKKCHAKTEYCFSFFSFLFFRDEVDRRDVRECDGRVCVLEVIGAPSMLRLTRKVAVLARVFTTLTFSCAENAARRKWKSPRSC